MPVTLSFFGAAGTVTGACCLVEHESGRFLVDCGLFQGSKTLRELNYGAFPFDPTGVDRLFLTHAHIDHSGLVPKLVKAGFRGPVMATEGTTDLLSFMLPDSGYIQETEVERLNRRNQQRGRPTVTPIYTRADAEASLRAIRKVPYDRWIAGGKGVRARFWNAGHILGSASIEFDLADGTGARRLLFSGDIGPEHKMFHPDPKAPRDFDVLVVESTYGDRDRPAVTPEQRRQQLRQEVTEALARGGNLLIPCFAVERSQELLLDLGLLFARRELPAARVYLDSPLAVRATEVFARHARALEDLGALADPFRSPHIHFVETVEQSKAIGRIASGAIILAASGMCEAGRIRHHLKQNLWRPQATVLFVGYQAPGTLGHVLQQGADSVRIHGEEVRVRATLRQLDSYSGHADRAELLAWVRERMPIAQAIFLTHGEEGALAALARGLGEMGTGKAALVIPRLDERYALAAKGAPRALPSAPRLPAAALAARDWHNEYAALILDLQHALQGLADDATREGLLRRLRQVLDEAARPAARTRR